MGRKKKYKKEMETNFHLAPPLPENADKNMQRIHRYAWFLFNYVNPITKTYPAEEFVYTVVKDPDWENAVKYMTRMFHGKFQVVEMIDQYTGNVISEETGDMYTVGFRVGHERMEEGAVFEGYIHPWFDDLYLNNGVIWFHPSVPTQLITPGIAKHLFRRLEREWQDKTESVNITYNTKLKTHLKAQPATQINKMTKLLKIKAKKRKEEQIEQIHRLLTGKALHGIIESLTDRHILCIKTVLKHKIIKHHILAKRLKDDMDSDKSTIRELYGMGLLMLGSKMLNNRRQKVVIVPRDIRENLDRMNLLQETPDTKRVMKPKKDPDESQNRAKLPKRYRKRRHV